VIDTPDLAAVAALVGDRARGRMLAALMEGRALTATELALEGGVAPSTASSHLAKLAEAGLVTIARQGRHRYFRVAGAPVAAALEGLMAIAPRPGRRVVRTGPAASRSRSDRAAGGTPEFTSGVPEDGLRRARVCYDHLAGEAAVRLLAALRARKWVRVAGEEISLTAGGEDWFRGLGVDLDALRARRRPVCRPCLDWSERQFHLAGSLGAALLDRLFALRFVKREVGSRALLVSPRGASFLENLR
jgi:DNA-binding transcriptional ArsR family regulator